MAFYINNPNLPIPNMPALPSLNELNQQAGAHNTPRDSVYTAKVSQDLLNSSSKEVEPAFPKEEAFSRKRKERECSSEFSLESHRIPQMTDLAMKSISSKPYVPFYTIDPVTKSPKPPVNLAPFMPKDRKYLDFFPRDLQPPTPNEETLRPVSASSSSSSSADASSSSSSSVSITQISSADPSSVPNTGTPYSLRKVRTPNRRYAQIEDSKPSEKEQSGIIKSFKEKEIEYVADVQIDPKYQSTISAIFSSIPDDKLSDDTNSEGRTCSLCIKTASDDASDKYASAIEIKEVIFSLEDGSKIVEKGVFAKQQIKKGSAIGIYAGDLVPLDAYKDRDKDYVFEFSEPAFEKWGIDAKKRGNFTRYINHCKEENENVTGVGFYDGNIPRIIFIATTCIQKGTQIMYDYGDGYWERKGFKPSNF